MAAGVIAIAAALAAVLASAAFPTGAWAHGGSDRDGYSNYASRVLSVSPPVPGLDITAYGVAGGVRLENRSGQDVVVLGYDNEPFLRVNSTGTFANLRSRTTFTVVSPDINLRSPGQSSSDPSTEPDWVQVSSRKYVRWHDDRTHWIGSQPPQIVTTDRSVAHVVYDAWTVPLVVDSNPVTVTGELVYLPPPSQTRWLLLGIVVLVAATLVLYLLRASRAMLLLALLGALGCNAVVAAARATTEDAIASRRLLPFVAGGVAILLVLIGSFSRRRSGPPLLWGAAGAILLGASIAYFDALSYSVVDGATDPDPMRWSVIVEFGLGAAIALLAIVGMIQDRMINRSVAALMEQHQAALDARDEGIADGYPPLDDTAPPPAPMTHPPHND